LNLPDSIWLGAYWNETTTTYLWNMCFDNITLSWGNWDTGQDPTPDTEHCLVLNQNKKFQNVNCSDHHDILCGRYDINGLQLTYCSFHISLSKFFCR